MKTCLFYGLIGLLFLNACAKDFEGEFPLSKPQPVLNGLVAADSILSIELSWSLAPDSERAFEFITNAIVRFWEDEEYLGIATHTENGRYVLDYVGKEAKFYTVEVEMNTGKLLSATTYVPERMVAYAEKTRVGGWTKIKTDIPLLNKGVSGVWLSVVQNDGDGRSFVETAMNSNTIYADNFNRSIESESSSDLPIYSFYQTIRLHGNLLIHEKHEIDLFVGGMQFGDLYLIYGSHDYDIYFRELIKSKLWHPSSNIPFTYAPAIIYSNVQNGYGIFAGYSVQKIVL